jgi:hypothetical protein
MKTSMFMAAVVLVSAVTGGLLVAYRFQPGEDAKAKDKPNFPFTTQDCPEGVCVYRLPCPEILSKEKFGRYVSLVSSQST